MQSEETTQTNSFFKKHPIISIIALFITGIVVAGSMSGAKEQAVENNLPVVTQEKQETAPEAGTISETEVIDYEIVHTDTDARFDGGIKYYVLIDPVDINSDGFKENIKNLVQKIVSEKGTKISLDIFDNRSALDVLYRQYGDMSLGRPRSAEENALVERHTIATFDGQLSTMFYPDSLTFFPATFTSHPEIGQHVETISFKP